MHEASDVTNIKSVLQIKPRYAEYLTIHPLHQIAVRGMRVCFGTRALITSDCFEVRLFDEKRTLRVEYVHYGDMYQILIEG